MGGFDFDQALLNISPGRCAEDRAIAAMLRERGLWDALCRAALWQCATFGGVPVRSETCTLGEMLEHFAHQESKDAHLRAPFIDAVGEERLRALLARTGRRHLTALAWRTWKRRLGLPLVDEDGDTSLYADGWVERLGSGAAPPTPSLAPGQVPLTEPDENVAWGYHEESGEVYAIPI